MREVHVSRVRAQERFRFRTPPTSKAGKGAAEAEALRERWRHEITVALQRRKKAMMRAVMPGLSGRKDWIARGGEGKPGEAMLPIIEQDEEAA